MSDFCENCMGLGIISDGVKEFPCPYCKGNSSKSDPVNNPTHYKNHPSGIECIEITKHMSFCIGNAMKYLWRADEKGAPIQDLRKAIRYIEIEIQRREAIAPPPADR